MAVDLGYEGMPSAIVLSVGNPHAVHIVDDAEAIDVAGIGAVLERHALFPERANVEFVSVLGEDKIRMRVWERGSGVTIACGSGACASAVAAARVGLTGREVEVVLDGGALQIDWREDGGVTMTGGATHVFRGVIDLPRGEA